LADLTMVLRNGWCHPIRKKPVKNNLELTPEERGLLLRWRAQSETLLAYLGYYGAILLPMVAFAAYGIIKRDVIALSIAFAGLLIYQLYRIATELSQLALYQSLASKIADVSAET
jgi:hypothetical protein